MKTCSKFLLFNAFALCGIVPTAAQAHSNTRIAIARPFSLSDASKLPESLDAWNIFPPCSDPPEYSTDLLLVFQGSLEKDNHIWDTIHEVGSIHIETNGWGNCIDKVIAIGSDMDIKTPREFWMDPSRIDTLHMLSGEPYDFICLMGIDRYPIKTNWLDAVVEEIENHKHDFFVIRR